MQSPFPATSWGLIARAAQPLTPEGHAALAALCERYWDPVYAFIRHSGAGAEDARDLTQGFFTTRWIEKNDLRAVDRKKGRFRNLLLVCVRRYLTKQRDHKRIERNGGGRPLESFDPTLAESLYAVDAAHGRTPERLYERRFALALLEDALTELGAQYTREGPEQARRFHALQGRLDGSEGSRPHGEVAAELGITVEAVRTATSRMYDDYEAQLRAAVARTIDPESAVDDELRWILAALGDDP
jgi:RNA polymerase sigma-70 factor (ECF subfamily)